MLNRETTATTVTFRLAARPGVIESVLDLVRREAACCPFLSYEVDQEGEEIVWTTTGMGAADIAALDDVLAGADPATRSSEDLARRLTDRGGIPVIVPAVRADRPEPRRARLHGRATTCGVST